MYHVRTRNLSDLVNKFTDWEQFQSLGSELISPRIQINLREEADTGALYFIASILRRTGYQQAKLHFWTLIRRVCENISGVKEAVASNPASGM
jgi:hypothetical protein